LQVRDIVASGKYDLVAVLPLNEKLFHTSCNTLNIDIICIDGGEKLPYIPKHNVVKSAASRGIYFEASEDVRKKPVDRRQLYS